MRKLALMVAATLVVAACGGTDAVGDALVEQIVEQAGAEGVDISTGDDGSVSLSIEGEDGSGQMSFSEELPADFPLPLPDGYEVGTSFVFEDESGTSYTVVIQIAEDAFDATQEMYEGWLEKEGFEVDTLEMQSTVDKATFITAERDDASVAVSMTVEAVANDDAGNLTYAAVISMSWTPSG